MRLLSNDLDYSARRRIKNNPICLILNTKLDSFTSLSVTMLKPYHCIAYILVGFIKICYYGCFSVVHKAFFCCDNSFSHTFSHCSYIW